MFAQALNAMTEQNKLFVEPILEMNRIALAQAQKLGQKQLELINDYAKLGLDQLNNVAKVKSVEEYKVIAEDQLKSAADVSRKVIEDTNAFVALGQEMSAEWKQFVEGKFNGFVAETQTAKNTKK